MATVKGEKTGGRKKGSPNKRTQSLIEKLEAANYCPVEDLLNIIRTEQLEPMDRANIDMKLMEYLYPKRKAVEITEHNQFDGPLKFVVQDELNEAPA